MDTMITPQNTGLSLSTLNQLSQYDDFVNFYLQINEAVNGFSWMKADTLCRMEDRLGSPSLKVLSQELGERYSTLVSYIRVSRAFPPEKRDIGASFSLHFQASFADSYNKVTKEFDGETRFDWRDKALDDNMSTRTLQKEIQANKQPPEKNQQSSYVESVGEGVRRAVATMVKLWLKGDPRSQNALEQIEKIVDEYRSI